MSFFVNPGLYLPVAPLSIYNYQVYKVPNGLLGSAFRSSVDSSTPVSTAL